MRAASSVALREQSVEGSSLILTIRVDPCSSVAHFAPGSAARLDLSRSNPDSSLVRVQIAGVSTLEEALECERAGVDALGFTVRLPHGIHDGLTEDKARSIVAALPPFISTVAITYVDNAREAVELCRFLGVSTLQLHGDFPTPEIPLVRAGLPHLRIIRAMNVVGPESVERVRDIQRRVDAVILDTFDPDTGMRGATGKTHDWELSRQIVERSRVPVILAGGLTPDNVAAAIETVGPWGVDVHTGVEDADGRRNLDKVRDFLINAKNAVPSQRPATRPARPGPKKWGSRRRRDT